MDGICGFGAWRWPVSIIDWTHLEYDTNDQVSGQLILQGFPAAHTAPIIYPDWPETVGDA
jgi:hypothetical protein